MALSTPFSVDGKTYVISRPMSVPDQMHVVRKLGPFLPRIPRVLKALDALRTAEERREAPLPEPEEPTAAPPETDTKPGGAAKTPFDLDDPLLDEMLGSMEPLLSMFAEMKEEDINSVMVKCFRCVDRVGQGGVQPIWNARANDFQFAGEMDIGVAAFICKEVIAESIGPFLREKMQGFVARHRQSTTPQSDFPGTEISTPAL